MYNTSPFSSCQANITCSQALLPVTSGSDTVHFFVRVTTVTYKLPLKTYTAKPRFPLSRVSSPIVSTTNVFSVQLLAPFSNCTTKDTVMPLPQKLGSVIHCTWNCPTYKYAGKFLNVRVSRPFCKRSVLVTLPWIVAGTVPSAFPLTISSNGQ